MIGYIFPVMIKKYTHHGATVYFLKNILGEGGGGGMMRENLNDPVDHVINNHSFP
jgi:hypothetical protein